ncbi:hypothetical protein [Amycolatopsis viridis]|uniref:Uncharacterized protein n=1 Tax=Amycolatopsis viridis TaxID=185678 RepID=A0ABX0SVK9_9PSEU|nr:hypothetical protein [Amycolatopsis viridis]NIH79694.1 hypothetical protein [Amycolatopsis viridis]
MTEYEPQPGTGRTEGAKSPRMSTEIIDVLMRGLVAARDRLGAGEVEPDSLVCAGLYYDGHHYCPVLYLN